MVEMIPQRKGAGWIAWGLLAAGLGVVLLLAAGAHAVVFSEPGPGIDVDWAPLLLGLGLACGLLGVPCTAVGAYRLVTYPPPAQRRSADPGPHPRARPDAGDGPAIIGGTYP